MKGVRARRGGYRRRGWQWSPVVVLLLGPVLAWILVDHRHGWTTADILAAVTVGVTISGALAALLDSQLRQRRAEKDRSLAPSGLSQERLEEWRVRLRSAVIKARIEHGGQLDQMVRYGEALDLSVSLADGDSRLPRLSVGGQMLAWSEIKRRWDESRGRMVILGEPGYGKTVAALTLVAHINNKPGAVVAELFSLADWYLWQAEHAGARLGDWLAEQLTLTYAPGLPLEVSRHLVAERLVLPILDGLDEIPTIQERRVCVDMIDSYTRRAAPHRPFVLTCRAEEYAQLSPNWVSAEQHILLAGLQPAQIDTILNERTIGRAGWDTIRLRHAAGDATLRELLRSPLYLATTLQVYRDRDPSELVDLDVRETIGRVWDLLLSDTAETFRGATVTEVRRWLEFLAAGMRRTSHQSFMLHELYLMDPDRATTRQGYRRTSRVAFGLTGGLGAGLIVGLIFGLSSGLTFGLSGTPIVGLSGGLIAGLSGGLVSGFAFALHSYTTDTPSTQEPVGWRVRTRSVETGTNFGIALSFGLIAGLIAGLIGGTISGLRFGLVLASEILLLLVVEDIVQAGTERVEYEPPTRFTRKRPDAVLSACRNSGLLSWLSQFMIVAVVIGLCAFSGVFNGVFIGVFAGVLLGMLGVTFGDGLSGGLDAWLYHYWLRWRLYTRGLLPRHLPQFLDWCAQPSRGWLRITNAYQFRHRALLDHLAPAPSPPDDEIAQD